MTETPATDFIAQANLMHEQGPYVTPPSTLYFTYLKPDWRKRSWRRRPVPRCTCARGSPSRASRPSRTSRRGAHEQAAKAAPKAEGDQGRARRGAQGEQGLTVPSLAATSRRRSAQRGPVDAHACRLARQRRRRQARGLAE